MWVMPLMAAALSDTKAGLPVKNGSISTALPAKSSRKAEWPYQMICMTVVLGLGGGRQNTQCVAAINAHWTMLECRLHRFDSSQKCHAPRKAGIQYSAVIAGSPAFAG